MLKAAGLDTCCFFPISYGLAWSTTLGAMGGNRAQVLTVASSAIPLSQSWDDCYMVSIFGPPFLSGIVGILLLSCVTSPSNTHR